MSLFLCWFFTCSHFGFSFLLFCCTINCDVRIRLIMHSFYMWLCSMTTYCDAMRCDLIPPTHCVRTITFEPLNAICKPFLCLFIAFLSADIPFLKTHHLNYQITRPKYFVLIEKWCDLKITLALFIKRKEKNERSVFESHLWGRRSKRQHWQHSFSFKLKMVLVHSELSEH